MIGAALPARISPARSLLSSVSLTPMRERPSATTSATASNPSEGRTRSVVSKPPAPLEAASSSRARGTSSS